MTVQTAVRASCNTLAELHDTWLANLTAGERAIQSTVDARGSLRSLGALHLGPLAEVPGLLEASAHKLQAQEREGLRVLRAAQASLQDVAARATVEWDVRPEGRLDAVPVFASLAWSAVAQLFDAASQAYLTDVKVKACALAWLESGCGDTSSPSNKSVRTRDLEEGILLAWRTDLYVPQAVQALRGAMEEDMKGF